MIRFTAIVLVALTLTGCVFFERRSAPPTEPPVVKPLPPGVVNEPAPKPGQNRP